MSGYVTTTAIWTGKQLRIVDEFGYRLGVKALKLGEGEEVVIRIERPADAVTAGQRNYYFGYVVGPLSQWNGDFKSDWHLLLKAMFMPEGKTSITQLTKKEFDEYILNCEVYAHTDHPEAFALYDQRPA